MAEFSGESASDEVTTRTVSPTGVFSLTSTTNGSSAYTGALSFKSTMSTLIVALEQSSGLPRSHTVTVKV